MMTSRAYLTKSPPARSPAAQEPSVRTYPGSSNAVMARALQALLAAPRQAGAPPTPQQQQPTPGTFFLGPDDEAPAGNDEPTPPSGEKAGNDEVKSRPLFKDLGNGRWELARLEGLFTVASEAVCVPVTGPLRTQLDGDLRTAIDMTNRALAVLSAEASKKTRSFFNWYFSDDIARTQPLVRNGLEAIRDALVRRRETANYGLGTREDSAAHTFPLGKNLWTDNGAPICIDPEYFSESSAERPLVWIHEAGHTVGLVHAEAPDFYLNSWPFFNRGVITSQALANSDSYAYLVEALANNAVPTRVLGTVGVDLGSAFSQGPSARIHAGAELQHPDWGFFNPSGAVSLDFASGGNFNFALSFGVRIAGPRSTNYGPYLYVGGKASLIAGNHTVSVGPGGEGKLGFRSGHSDFGVVVGTRGGVQDSFLPSALFAGLGFAYVGK